MGLDTSRHDMMQSLLEGVVLRAAEVISAMGELVPLADCISVDGGMARNGYVLQFLSNVLQKQVAVPSSPDLTAFGTARMAMRGAGVAALPPLPPPRRIVEPQPTIPDARARFAEAVKRAKGWRA